MGSLPKKRLSRKLDLGDLSSDQFCNLVIKEQWKNIRFYFALYLLLGMPCYGYMPWHGY